MQYMEYRTVSRLAMCYMPPPFMVASLEKLQLQQQWGDKIFQMQQ